MVQIRRQTDEAKGSPTIGRRVGGKIETVGVAPVPDDQRVQTPRQMFIVYPSTVDLLVALAAAFFVAPRRLADRVVLIAIAAVAVGFVLGFWGEGFLPGFFYNTLPLPVLAGLVAAALYGAAAALWPPPQAAGPAAADAPASPAEQ
jgi:hypothetical protein